MAGPSDGRESRDTQSRYRRAALEQPLRRRIARRLAEGGEASAVELAAALEAPLGRVAYHLRVLRRRRVLRVVPRRNPTPPRYRWGPDAQWARAMLADEGTGDEKDA
jgi:DNA-binding transcriptional ArsR family regulator